MTYSVKEQKEKFERIEELRKEGFNVPRFIFLPKNSPKEEFIKVRIWAENLWKTNMDQIFNIRTYNYSDISKKESLQTEHLTDLYLTALLYNLEEYNPKFNCMIDAEIPDNGRLAGNIAIVDSGITIEFITKKHRAMVRDINTMVPNSISSTNSLSEINKAIYNSINYFRSRYTKEELLFLSPVLSFVAKKAFSFKKRNVIIEFTYFSTPSGILYNKTIYPESHIVWWEWRKY